MATFANAMRNEGKVYTRTENGAMALNSTGSDLLDFFATIGGLRTSAQENPEIVREKFLKALTEDKLLATKALFYTRDIRGGLGERESFRVLLHYLAVIEPNIVIRNMTLIPEYGRWDDLYALIGTEAESTMWEFIRMTLNEDYRKMLKGEPISLCGKWVKSANATSVDSRRLGKLTAFKLGMNESDYRHGLTALRAYLKVVEALISKKKWSEINYEAVPSRAMKNLRKAFAVHDEVRFNAFVASVTKGEKKINASTLYPYDILRSMNLRRNSGGFGYGRTARTGDFFTVDNDAVLEAQWKALPNYVKGKHTVVVMADTSNSMATASEGLPMCTAVALAIYFAERNEGVYQNLFMTFSESPRFVQIKGDTLAEKVACVPAIVENTDLEKAFDLILHTANNYNMKQEELPEALVVISDMQFDAGEMLYNHNQTFYQSMKRKFEANGYTMPALIFWNVDDRRNAFQAEANEKGVMLASGHATSTFRDILNNIGTTPFEFMMNVLNGERYSAVKL